MKKILSTILFSLLILPTSVFGQTEATVSKTVTSYRGVKDVDSKVIKKSSESNSLNVLLQVSLINAGYNSGEPDGVIGSKTIKAIKSLQSDFGLLPDGVFGSVTASSLRDFSDRFPNQKVSEVKRILPKEFAQFKNELNNSKNQLTSSKNTLNGMGKLQLPITPKGVLTYVLSKNQPTSIENSSSSSVGSLIAKLTNKPKSNNNSTGSTSTVVSPGGGSVAQESMQLNTNFSCVTTGEHTEYCNVDLPANTKANKSYYCRGVNCEVLGLTNKPSTSVESYKLPTNFTQNIDFSQKSEWGEPVVFDKETGKPTIYLRDHGSDPNNGQRNLSVIFVDLVK